MWPGLCFLSAVGLDIVECTCIDIKQRFWSDYADARDYLSVRSLHKIEVKIPRKCHSQEAQPSFGTNKGSDEEQISTTQMPRLKPQMLRVTTKEPHCYGKLLGP